MSSISQTLTPLPTPPSRNDPANFNRRADDFLAALPTFKDELDNFGSQTNTVANEVNQNALSASNSADQAANSELIAKATANFQGFWAEDETYNIGESIYIKDVGFFIALQNNTGKDPTKTSGYWVANVPSGAVGNIANPLLNLPLKNSLVMEAGVGAVTFSRSTKATYIDRYGVLKTAAIDEPRFEKEGLLIEGSSTNLLTYSNKFDHDNWEIRDSSLEVSDELGPDGVTQCWRWYGGTGSHSLFQIISTSNNTVYTASIWVKSNGSGKDRFRLRINPTKNVDELTATDEWVRYTMTQTSDGSRDGFNISRPSDGEDVDLLIAFAQTEELPFASSYIPTTDATVTRSRDLTAIEWKNNCVAGFGPSTTIVDVDMIGSINDKSQYIWSSDSYVYESAIANKKILSKEGFVNVLQSLAMSTTPKCRIATSSSGAFSTICINGEKNYAAPRSFSKIPATKIYIGSNSWLQNLLFGHVSNFRIYDRALTPHEIKLA